MILSWKTRLDSWLNFLGLENSLIVVELCTHRVKSCCAGYVDNYTWKDINEVKIFVLLCRVERYTLHKSRKRESNKVFILWPYYFLITEWILSDAHQKAIHFACGSSRVGWTYFSFNNLLRLTKLCRTILICSINCGKRIFQRRSVNPKTGGAKLLFLANLPHKLHEGEKKWLRGGGCPALDPPMNMAWNLSVINKLHLT